MYRPHKPAKSSQIVSFGYDKDLKILEVEFFRNAVYQYFGVPNEVYEEMCSAEFLGLFLNQKIKGVYVYQKI